MKVRSAILILALVATAQAAAAKRPPHMTGDQVIAELRGAPNVQRLFDRHYALGYVAGVADATQGRTWCAPSGVKPETADGQVMDELAKRAAGSMPRMASDVLLEQYSATFAAKDGVCSFKPRLTGDELAVWLLGNRRKSNTEKSQPSPELVERERYADGYVGGVIDATQGTDWCAPRRIKPGELDAAGYWGLLDRPRGSMPDNAATLLHKQFLTKYPCRPQP